MTDFGTIIDAHTVRFERLLPGPVERVWDYLTKPELLALWLADAKKLELRPGGCVELQFEVGEVPERKECGGDVIQGVITRYEPPRVLAYSWVSPAEGRPPEQVPTTDSVVTFELEPRGKDVLLVLTHRRLPTVGIHRFAAGWHTHLGILEARARGQQPKPFLDVFNAVQSAYEKLVAKAGGK